MNELIKDTFKEVIVKIVLAYNRGVIGIAKENKLEIDKDVKRLLIDKDSIRESMTAFIES